MSPLAQLRAAAALALAGLTTAASASPPDIHCALTTPVTEVSKVADLPWEVRKLIGPVAEAGAIFNKTDGVTDPSLPFKRLIRAGHLGPDWFVWYEHGGITYFWHAMVVRIPPGGGGATTLANAGTISDTLCALTDAAFAGRIPPYPAGTWATSYF